MAYLATKRNQYWTQLAILCAVVGGGFILALIINYIAYANALGFDFATKYTQKEISEKILVPENANMVRLVQFLSTFVMFGLPAFLYAKISHKRPLMHLGFKSKTTIVQAALVIIIMIACLPLVGALTELTEALPFSKEMFEKFKAAEVEYNDQISIIGKMDSFPEFLLSLFMLAILPAVFEEVMFRGAVQNLLSRWWMMPVLAIIVTSLLFSLVHFSYLGFLSRAVLGFVLGWMFYRTGNIWLSIIAHAANNAVALTALYIVKKNNPAADLSKADPHIPSWVGLAAVAVVYGLFIVFEKISKHQINKPGEEVLIEIEDVNNPSWIKQN